MEKPEAMQAASPPVTRVFVTESAVEFVIASRGGATVLKVGDKFCERSEQKIFLTPLFGQWGHKIRR